jgi:hypothetical protein
MTPVDTSAEAVERVSREDEARIESALRYDDNEMQGAFQEGYLRALTIAGRASDAYQRRLESADKIIADALPFVAQWEASDAADLESQSLMVKRIDAHLAGEDMGRGE